MTQARGEYCALLDDDVPRRPDLAPGIDRAVATHPTADVFTGSVIATPAQSQPSSGSRSSGFPEGVRRAGRGRPRAEQGQALVNASRIGTGESWCCGMTADLPSPEQLGAGTAARGGEDLDVVVCALVRGRTVVFAPDMLVRHPAPVDWPALRRQSFEYGRGLTVWQPTR